MDGGTAVGMRPDKNKKRESVCPTQLSPRLPALSFCRDTAGGLAGARGGEAHAAGGEQNRTKKNAPQLTLGRAHAGFRAAVPRSRRTLPRASS